MPVVAKTPVTNDTTDQANAKLNKMELMKKFKQHRDSVNKTITDLQRDSLTLSKDLQVCTVKKGELEAVIVDLTGKNDALSKQVTQLQEDLRIAEGKESPIVALMSPSGCAVLIVLIIAITAIALKKGFSIAKGDTKLSVGGDDGKPPVSR